MTTKNIYRLASLLVVISLLVSTRLVAHASSQDAPLQAATNYPNLAWFYKPPSDGNLSLIAQNFSTLILTKNDELSRDQLLSMGMQRPVLEYLNFEAIHDPGSCTAQPWRSQVAYKIGDFCDISANHPDWFMLNTSGQRIIRMDGTATFVMMDPGNAGWRAFYVSRLKEIFAADPGGWDGVFLDNVEITNDFYIRDNQTLANYPDNASFETAVQGFLEYLRANFFQPYGKVAAANLIAITNQADFTKSLTYIDEAMNESWATDWHGWRSATDWETQMTVAEQTQNMGKSIILVAQGSQTDLTAQNFAYASYLLVANGKASFRYANCSAYDQAWLYDNYKINLGAPKGARYLSGTAWRRDFANGYVTVDPSSHVAVIKLTSTSSATATATATAKPTLTPTKAATATAVPSTPVSAVTPTKTPTPQPTTVSSTSSVTFQPVADSYVIATSPDANYGTNTSFRVDNSPTTRSYLRFTVSGLNGSAVVSAKLRIYANSSNSTGYSVSRISSNTWGESSITYNNAPAVGTGIANTASVTAGTWITVDVTSYIKAEGTYSLVLTTTSDTATSLASRESGTNAPKLVITKSP